MTTQPDIPALIEEAREFVQAENWESDYEQDGGNTPGTGLIERLGNALAALSVSQPTTASTEKRVVRTDEWADGSTRELYSDGSSGPWTPSPSAAASREQVEQVEQAVFRALRDAAVSFESATAVPAVVDAVLAALPAPTLPTVEQIVGVVADRLGEHEAARNVFDITDEATTVINESVNEIAEWVAPSVLALLGARVAGARAEVPAGDPSMFEWAEFGHPRTLALLAERNIVLGFDGRGYTVQGAQA